MCGRYSFVPGEQLFERFAAENQQLPLHPQPNVAPGSTMPVVVRNSPNRVALMQWGLVPFFAKEPRTSYKTINARAETVSTAPTFRRPFRTRRCLVPASGFYEWKQTEHGKVPHYIRLKNHDLFAFAGLYDIWQDGAGNELTTYTIITTTPNSLMAPIHHRMPVLLRREDEDVWLDKAVQDVESLLALLRPYPADEMEAYPVSKAVNNPANAYEALTQPQAGAGVE
jgi:putative SOS response-associated peptidase YedK